jgi:hypothetical protein
MDHPIQAVGSGMIISTGDSGPGPSFKSLPALILSTQWDSLSIYQPGKEPIMITTKTSDCLGLSLCWIIPKSELHNLAAPAEEREERPASGFQPIPFK